MSLEETNLIDFDIKDEILVDIDDNKNINKNNNNYLFNSPTVSAPIFFQKNNFIVSPTCESWDDNPFDKIHKQVVLSDDPFEIVFNNNTSNNSNKNVASQFKTADLLSISAELNLNDIKTITPPATIERSTKVRNNSDPDCVKTKVINKDQVISDYKIRSTSLDNSLSTNLKKAKLMNNILNESSPMNNFLKNNQSSLENNEMVLEAREFAKKFSSMSKSGNSTINRLNSTDDSFEDIMSIKPNWIDSENENDSDIEQMRIPILAKIQDYNNESIDYSKYKYLINNNNNNENKTTTSTAEKNIVDEIVKGDDDIIVEEMVKSDDDIIVEANKTIENLSSIKLSDITTLMDNLKLAINKYNDNNKKTQASKLLENLNELLCNQNLNTNSQFQTPQPFVRQGTFDIDKKIDDEASISKSSNENSPNDEANVNENHGNVLACNNNLNILSNLNDLLNIPNNNMNPTYIVVMGGGVGQQQIQPQFHPQQYQNNETINNPCPVRINRSQSLSLHDKPQSVIKSLQNNINYNQNNTPMRSTTLRRRSSISSPISSVSRRTSVYSNTNNENYNSNDNSPTSLIDSRRQIIFSPTNNKQQPQYQQQQVTPKTRGLHRKSIGLKDDIQQPQIHQQQPTTLRSLNNITKYSQIGIKKIRHRASEMHNGPLKATIPLKKIIQKEMADQQNKVYINQITKPLCSSTPVISVTTDKNVLNPMLARKRVSAINPPTSPHYQQQQTTNNDNQKQTNSRRVSFMSATPNPKSSTKLLTNTAASRRRTLSDYKEKNHIVASTTGVNNNNKNNNLNPSSLQAGTMKNRIQPVTPIRITKFERR